LEPYQNDWKKIGVDIILNEMRSATLQALFLEPYLMTARRVSVESLGRK
jgi:hypothetical protein